MNTYIILKTYIILNFNTFGDKMRSNFFKHSEIVAQNVFKNMPVL